MASALTIVLSGLFASIVAVLVTLAIEKFGGVLGGVLGSMPGTVIPAAVGWAVSAPNADSLLNSSYTFPIGMLLNVQFLLLWRELPKLKIIARIQSFGQKLGVLVASTISIWLVTGLTLLAIVNQLHG